MTTMPIQPVARQPLSVFLCHSSRDKQRVRELYHRLRSDGFAPWLDENELLPGQEWQEEIVSALKACDVVMVCLSKGSVTKEGFVQKEIKFALDVAQEKPEGAVFIIPVRLDQILVPQALQRWHWADLFDENGYQKIILSLTRCAAAKRISTAEQSASAIVNQMQGTTAEEEARCGAVNGAIFERRMRLIIKLKCTPEDFLLVSETVQELLRKISNDATLTIKRIRTGSVILEIDCSESGSKVIKSLFETQELAKLLDFFGVEKVSIEQIQKSGTMTCAQFLKALVEYLDGSVTPSIRGELEEHLHWCHDCYVVMNTTKKTIEIYSAQNRPSYDVREVLVLRNKIGQRLARAKYDRARK